MMAEGAMKARLIPEKAVPMDNWNGHPQPTQAIIYEMSIEAKAGTGNRDVDLRYSAVKILNGVTDHAAFLKAVKDIVAKGGGIGQDRPKRTRDPNPGNKRSKDTRLSIDWDTRGLYYLVIKLDHGRDWQFSSDYRPFMMHVSDAGKGRFFGSERFDQDGNPVADMISTEGSKFAYFIVDGVKLDRDGSGEFQHRFNIHIELLEMNGIVIDSRIPIIIDPDVRHPGGSSGP